MRRNPKPNIQCVTFIKPFVRLYLIFFIQSKTDHAEDLKLFEQKLMMHFNPQFMDEEHSDHQATESH